MKNTLLAVTGLSPQVITETLYALFMRNRSVSAIHIITTLPGKDRLLAQLLDGGRGPFYTFLKEYGPPDQTIEFGPGNIHVVRNSIGEEIKDIEDESDNDRILSKCMQLTFTLTRDPDAALFFSIAGGRKTMGACLTLAAQMYGRSQDRLCHVLIPAEFESCRSFFYPPKKTAMLQLLDGKGEPYFKSTDHARVNLIHVPFFSVRAQLSPEVLDQPHDPATLMLSLIRDTKERLTIDINQGKIRYLGVEADMMPNRLALYAFFALLKKECPAPENTCKTCDQCFIDYEGLSLRQADITKIYKQLCGTRPTEEMSSTGITSLNKENFNSLKSRINKELIDTFGTSVVSKLQISALGKRPDTRYGLSLDRDAIEVVM